jgi:hypothetical protein
MEVDPDFEKHLRRIEVLPEAKKKEDRDHLYSEARIKPATKPKPESNHDKEASESLGKE